MVAEYSVWTVEQLQKENQRLIEEIKVLQITGGGSEKETIEYDVALVTLITGELSKRGEYVPSLEERKIIKAKPQPKFNINDMVKIRSKNINGQVSGNFYSLDSRQWIYIIATSLYGPYERAFENDLEPVNVNQGDQKKFMAYNTQANDWVRWLGFTYSKEEMAERLKQYRAPSHVVAMEVQQK